MIDKAFQSTIGSLFGVSKSTSQDTANQALQTGANKLDVGADKLGAAADRLQLGGGGAGGGAGGLGNLAGSDLTGVGSKILGSGGDLTDVFEKYGTDIGKAEISGLSGTAGGSGGIFDKIFGGGTGAAGGGGIFGSMSGLLRGANTVGSMVGLASNLAGGFGKDSTGGGLGSVLGAALPLLGMLFSLEQGGIVPSAAAGWQVPNVGSGSIMAQLHANEMVLPSGISSFIQSAAAGAGGGGMNFAYSPTINSPASPDMKQLLSRHGSDMLYWLQSQFRSGALRVPA